MELPYGDVMRLLTIMVITDTGFMKSSLESFYLKKCSLYSNHWPYHTVLNLDWRVSKLLI